MSSDAHWSLASYAASASSSSPLRRCGDGEWWLPAPTVRLMSELGRGPPLPPNAGGGTDGPVTSGIGTCRVAGLAVRRSADVRHVHDEAMTSSRSWAVSVE